MLKILFLLFLCHLTYPKQTSNETDTNALLSGLDWAVWCKFQSNAFNCQGAGMLRLSFYYDIDHEDCRSDNIGKCPHNLNSFNSRRECKETCKESGREPITENLTARVYCRLQPSFGDCNSYHPMFYYDMTRRLCRGFSFSGCGGNSNRFESKQQCQTICASAVKYT